MRYLNLEMHQNTIFHCALPGSLQRSADLLDGFTDKVERAGRKSENRGKDRKETERKIGNNDDTDPH